MKYEIKTKIEMKDGRVVNKSELTDTVEMATRDGLNAIKYIKEGKTRYTWIEVPNDFQMKNYYNSFEVTVSEMTTGKNIYKITK